MDATAGEEDELQIWEDSNNLTFTPLGSGREVGRSCHVMEFKGKKIMLDIGIHPGRKGDNMLPYLDRVDLETIDLLLLSHFHLDHAGSLPYLTERTGFKGQIYMTSSTKAVLQLVLKDYARIQQNDPDYAPLYTQEEAARCLRKCQTIGFHQVIEVDGIKITPYHAGHVLGAAMFLMEIAGVRILYTGDYSREDDRHLRGAEIPSIGPDVLIVEATFGVIVHDSREQREKRFTEAVEKVVRRGGNCLIPMGALGAVQELLLILEDHWNKHPDLKGIPIYHTSRIANEALNVYRTFINEMNDEMRLNQLSKPWQFESIGSLGENEEIVGPAVVLASPGYLQSGKSRKLFEMWCSDRKNGVILAGYAVEGTLAKELSREAMLREIVSLNGTIIPVECEIKTITFAAHSDFIGTKSFVDQLKPKNIIFVHGESEQMKKLKSALARNAAQMNLETDFFTPDNCTTVRLSFKEQRVVKAYGGEIVQKRMRTDGQRIAAYLVRKDFSDRFISAEDLRGYTQLKTTTVTQKLHLPFHFKFDHLRNCVGKLFSFADVEGQPGTLIVLDKVELCLKNDLVRMTWDASPSTDMIADALTSILMQAEGGVAAVRISTCCQHSYHHHHHHHDHDNDGDQPTEEKDKDQETTELDKQPTKKRAKVSIVINKSENAILLHHLLREKYGEDNLTENDDLLTINCNGESIEVSFDADGHVLSVDSPTLRDLEATNPTEDEETGDQAQQQERAALKDKLLALKRSVLQLVQLTDQTTHVL